MNEVAIATGGHTGLLVGMLRHDSDPFQTGTFSDVALVGGSLCSRGGQNMIEPAAHGVPAIVGPNTANFRDVVEGLRWAGGIRIIPSAAELTPTIHNLLTDKETARRQSAAARCFVLAQQGATDRTLTPLERLLDASPTGSKRAA